MSGSPWASPRRPLSVAPPSLAFRSAALSAALSAVLGLATAAAAQAVPPGPVEDIGALIEFAEGAPERPLAWGESWNPALDPEGRRPYLFLVGADSTVWVQGPDGRTSVTDAYVAMNVGRTAGERTGHAEPRTSHLGYGYEGGRVFLYLRQGVQAYAALGALVSVVVGTAVLVGWLAHRLRRERRQRRALTEVHRRLAEGREEERLRLAQDLHDGPVQDLNLVNLRLAAAAAHARAGGDGASAALPQGGLAADVAELQGEVVGVVRELRTIAEALRPPALGPFGLAAALRAHAERFRRLHPAVRVRLDLDDDGQALPEGVRLALFRIAQEAMTNAAKHAAPTEVRVELRVAPDRVRLGVADDGAGYAVPVDLREYGQAGHYGLLGMEERAEAIGARLRVEGGPGRGTAVRVEAPRDAPEWRAPSMQHRV